MPCRDTIVIGASAGGVAALRRLVARLEADLPAAILVVLHTLARATSMMDQVLARAGPLPARFPEDRQPLERGTIWIAPPDRHLMVEDDRIRLTAGPRENRTRPAIDPLFRSAAVSRGSRVIGVILTGMSDDGSTGLIAVRQCGGLAVVQDPKEAEYPEMPQNALNFGEKSDYRLAVEEIGPLLNRLAHEEAPSSPVTPDDLKIEVEISLRGFVDQDRLAKVMGQPTTFVCPDCGGPLHENEYNGMVRFRCQIGHAFSPEALLEEQRDALDKALFTAVRALDERAKVFENLALREKDRGGGFAEGWIERATEIRQQSRLVWELLLSRKR